MIIEVAFESGHAWARAGLHVGCEGFLIQTSHGEVLARIWMDDTGKVRVEPVEEVQP